MGGSANGGGGGGGQGGGVDPQMLAQYAVQRGGGPGQSRQQQFQDAFSNYMMNGLGQRQNSIFGFPDFAPGKPHAHGHKPPTTGGNDPGTDGDGTDGTGDGGGNPTPNYWQFPQYTQTWAFTPPAPTPWNSPQPFDPKKYGNPFSNKNK